MTRISIRSVVSHEPIIRALAKFILAASVFATVFAALFPFDFAFPRRGLWNEAARRFDSSPYITPEDRLQNFLFFVPLGIGVAAVVRSRDTRTRAVARIVAGLLCGFALSMTLEILQVFVGFRDPTWSDVIMNTLGAVAGTAIVAAAGDQAIESVARWFSRLRQYATFMNLTIVLIGYSLVQLAFPLLTSGRGSLANWESAFPLLIGNEANGDRGWIGKVWGVDLASRATTPQQVAEIFRAGTASDVLADSLVASYRTQGPGPYDDLSGQLTPLEWIGNPPDELATTGPAAATQPAHVSGGRWLRTASAIAPATHRIRGTSQFTLVATVQPDEPFQEGPGRIVSISGGISYRNVALLHNRYDLSLRLRTPLLGPDGSAPEIAVEDVLDSRRPTQFVLSYHDPLLILYVDGTEHGRLEITPEAALIWRLYPRTGFKLRLARYGFTSYAAVYRLLVFIPFAALLAAASALSGRSRHTQIMIVVGVTLMMAVLLELVLGSLTASGFQPRNLLISLAIALGTGALLRMRLLST